MYLVCRLVIIDRIAGGTDVNFISFKVNSRQYHELIFFILSLPLSLSLFNPMCAQVTGPLYGMRAAGGVGVSNGAAGATSKIRSNSAIDLQAANRAVRNVRGGYVAPLRNSFITDSCHLHS